MRKEEIIERYGEEEYGKILEHNRTWQANNPDKIKAYNAELHPEICRKGGEYYEKNLEYNRTGLRGERNSIRQKHAKLYHPYKRIIAPESQLHHEWIPDTANYRGMALVEADQHMQGYIDVIQILEGKITLLTEEEVRNAGGGSL